ncbi:MAG: VanZ family protein [Proteobacteria bacterium]|nr:VanZ family protein [Pseudomonadota bacterium]
MTKISKQQSQFGFALFSYFLFLILIITLVPFDFQWPANQPHLLYTDFLDLITNIVLFLPFGFFCQFSKGDWDQGKTIYVFVYGAFISLFIETAQIFMIERFDSISDILMNGLGAWLGAMLYNRLKINFTKTLVGKLALEIPLMTIPYLIFPQILLNGLGAYSDPNRLWLIPLLGLLAAYIIVSIYIERLKPENVTSPLRLSIILGAGFIVVSIPGFTIKPLFMILCTAGVVSFIWITATSWNFHRDGNQRIEPHVLLRVIPLYACYLCMQVLLSFDLSSLTWQWQANISITWNNSATFIIQRLEFVAGFTILGYMMAEYRGRRNESFKVTIFFVLMSCFLWGGLLEMIRGFHPKEYASAVELMLILISATYGVVIYRLQLLFIHQLR